jgi:hypothetical protein
VVSLTEKGVGLQAFQPRVSIAYDLSGLWTTRLSYGAFSQHMITISNEDDIASLFEAWVPVPATLEYEEAHHIVGGLEGFPAADLSMSVQAYHKWYPSLVVYNRGKVLGTDPDYVAGTGSASGLEVLVRYGSTPVDLYLSYTLGWAEVTNGGLRYHPRYDRRHTLNAMGILRPFPDLELTLRWEYGSGYPFTQTAGYYNRPTMGTIGPDFDPWEVGLPYAILGDKNAARLPAYSRLDGSILYRVMVSSLRITAGITAANLLDRRNLLSYDRKTRQRVDMLGFYPTAVVKVEY